MAIDTTGWRILIDLPQKNPELGFREQAIALRNIIVNSKPRFAVGVFGPWGSGKTTLMNAVRDRLPEDNTVIVEFSAWRYEREEHLLIPLLDTLRQSLADWGHNGKHDKDIADHLLGAAKTVGHVLTALVASLGVQVGLSEAFKVTLDANKALAKAKELGEAAEAEDASALERALTAAEIPKSTYHAGFMALQRTFEAVQASHPDLRIVVFVDDLDRCLPKNMVAVLEAIKLFFDLDGFVFVVGVDREIVQQAIELNYLGKDGRPSGIVSGAEYIEKIFQVPFRLPSIRRDQLRTLVTSFETDAELPSSQAQLLREKVRTHLGFTMVEQMINPRAVKRFVNEFSIQMMFKTTLEPDIVLGLATLNTREDWRPVYQALLIEEPGFHDFLRRLISGEAKEGESDPDYPAISAELRAYLAGPGHALLGLDEEALRPYLSSAAAVSHDAGLGTGLRESGRSVARFRHLAKRAVDAQDEQRRELVRELVSIGLQMARGSGELRGWASHPGGQELLARLDSYLTRNEKLSPSHEEAVASEGVALGEQMRAFLRMIWRRQATL